MLRGIVRIILARKEASPLAVKHGHELQR